MYSLDLVSHPKSLDRVSILIFSSPDHVLVSDGGVLSNTTCLYFIPFMGLIARNWIHIKMPVKRWKRTDRFRSVILKSEA